MIGITELCTHWFIVSIADTKKAFLDLLLDLDYMNPGLFSEADIQEEVDTFMFEVLL